MARGSWSSKPGRYISVTAQGKADSREMTEEYILQAGNPANCQQFAKSHHEFLLRIPKLVELSNKTFNRVWATAEPLDRVVFTFGVMCWEDFEEILLLGANGYGFGCLKILRGMYERLVTVNQLPPPEGAV